MQLKRKLPWIITGKSLLAVGSIAMVALALVTYSATVNISFTPFFTQGQTTTAWTTSTSSGTRYLPGSTGPLGAPSIGTTSTFAFSTTTGGGYVRVGTSTAASGGDFQSFSIFVLLYNTTWNNVTLYTDPTFTTPLTTINGLSTANSGFIHINSGQGQLFFAIQVNYVLVGTPTDASAPVTFTYTPSLN